MELAARGGDADVLATYTIPAHAALSGAAYATQASGGQPPPPGTAAAVVPVTVSADALYFGPALHPALEWTPAADAAAGIVPAARRNLPAESTVAPTESDVMSRRSEQMLLP